VHVDLLFVRWAGRLAFVQRPRGGLWGGLWQPPGIEADGSPTDGDRRGLLQDLGIDSTGRSLDEVARVRRLLTHREVHLRAWSLSGEIGTAVAGVAWHDREGASDLGMARPVRTLIDAHGW
jgi:A/G-specific adenine glycosylase